MSNGISFGVILDESNESKILLQMLNRCEFLPQRAFIVSSDLKDEPYSDVRFVDSRQILYHRFPDIEFEFDEKEQVVTTLKKTNVPVERVSQLIDADLSVPPRFLVTLLPRAYWAQARIFSNVVSSFFDVDCGTRYESGLCISSILANSTSVVVSSCGDELTSVFYSRIYPMQHRYQLGKFYGASLRAHAISEWIKEGCKETIQLESRSSRLVFPENLHPIIKSIAMRRLKK